MEVCKHLAELVTSGNSKIRLDEFFDLPCLNVIWSLVNTSRFEYGDKHLKRMIELIDKFTMNSFVGPLGQEYSNIVTQIDNPLCVQSAFLTSSTSPLFPSSTPASRTTWTHSKLTSRTFSASRSRLLTRRISGKVPWL